jgi:hypothetical protein
MPRAGLVVVSLMLFLVGSASILLIGVLVG